MYLIQSTFRITPKQRQKSFAGAGLRAKARSVFGNIWLLLGVGVVLLYVGRVSVFYLWAGPFAPLLQWGGQGLLSVAIVLLIAKGVRMYSASGLVFIVLTLLGVLFGESFSQSILNWAAWAVLFSIFGPVLQGNRARLLRKASWGTFRWAFVLISIASFVWYIAGLPNLGRGAFTGVMMHSMLLGPIAAMASLFLAHRAISGRSRLYLMLSFLAVLSCLLAGSRSALLGLAAGVLVLLIFSIGRTGLNKSIAGILTIGIFMALGFAYLEDAKDKQLLYRYTLELEHKGLSNSRKGLWLARYEEFKKSPIVGIGIGVGDIKASTREWTGIVVDEFGNVNVEPGSSYLAVLSMTGILGLFGFCFVLASVFRKIKASKRIKKFDPEMFEVLAVLAFFAVHLAAEGYIFAVGNQFCLLFWLCLGRMHDLVSYRGNAKSIIPVLCRNKKLELQCSS